MTNETRTQFVAFLEYFSTTQDIVPGTQASSGGSQGDHLSEPHYPNTYVYTLEGPGSSPVEVRTNDGALSYLPITEEAHHDVPITPSAPSSTAGNIIKDSTVGIPYAVSSVAFFAPLASGDSVVGVDALLGRLGEIDKSVKGEWASAVGREDRAAISILYVDPTPTGGFARASTCAEFACEILIEKLPDHADFFKNNLLVRTLMLIGFLEGSRNKGETLVQEQWEAWQNTRPPALAGAASVIPRTEEATRSIRRQAKARYVNFLARLLFVIASTEFRKRVSDSFTGDAVVLIRYILNVIDLLESKLDALFQAEEGSDVEAESLQEDP
ncbi:hypothetical protein QFC24_003097 [Naganishia onofrii]|uniref:Uncharacterized protein n=1 Tax=Naganishia onofrii TaxID=1851511 RepID=A0ACC2XMQ3_9TREE|nr:hypothetical protein QFC24_003097 [Naganishia onofrii]